MTRLSLAAGRVLYIRRHYQSPPPARNLDMASTSYPFVAAGPDDSRSPCPALNALANHGYLPHDGKNISVFQLISALREVYGVSLPFAFGLAAGGVALCGKGFKLNLGDLCKHNAIEHDASLVHRDVRETGGPLATNKPDMELVKAIIDLSDGKYVTLDNLIKAKLAREDQAQIDNTHGYPNKLLRTFSHGELILIMELLQRDGPGVPVEWFREWIGNERIPEGWTKQGFGFWQTHTRGKKVSEEIQALHNESAKERRNK